jgi:hypothetical protein
MTTRETIEERLARLPNWAASPPGFDSPAGQDADRGPYKALIRAYPVRTRDRAAFLLVISH